jgi:hypothetical protein
MLDERSKRVMELNIANAGKYHFDDIMYSSIQENIEF